MSSLLEPYEKKFLEETKDVLEDYLHHDMIWDTLDVCTKRQLGNSNYIQKFPSVFECIRRKMYQLCQSSEQVEDNAGGGGGPTIKIPGIIDTRTIMKAFVKGFKHIKHKLEELAKKKNLSLENLEDKKRLEC